MSTASQLKKEFKQNADSKLAKKYARFFKTGPGEYGEGDVFIGLRVPKQRQIAKKYKDMELKEIQKLIKSEIHEHRMAALMILIMQYENGDCDEQDKIAKFYLKNKHHVNNWDLVDLSAHKILGDWLLDKDAKILYNLAQSNNLWDRRIAMVATFAFIREGKYQNTLKLAKIYLTDNHDLIHKATGWALREVGKGDLKVLLGFLDKYTHKMPRTMLRYSIEKLPDKKRKYYMNK